MTRERAADLRIIRAKKDEAKKSNPFDMTIPALQAVEDEIKRQDKRKRG